MQPWFLNEILAGLQKLASLSLDRTPAADVLAGTARVWMETLTVCRSWDQQRDTDRIRMAFVRLQASVRQWPAPRELLDAMPAADQPVRALTHDRGIPQTREARAARLRQLLGEDYNPQTADPEFDPMEAHLAARRAPRHP